MKLKLNHLSIICFLMICAMMAFAQEASPASVQALPVVSAGIFAWFTQHWTEIVAALASVMMSARLIVKLTPTPADDSILEKVITVLTHVGLKI